MAHRRRRTRDRTPHKRTEHRDPARAGRRLRLPIGAALGFKPLPQALGDDLAAATLPVFITGTLLFAFRPDGKQWWDYLDQIWSAYEKAETLDASVLPALQVHARMTK